MSKRHVRRLARHTNSVTQPRADAVETRYLDCYSKTWNPMFSKARSFKGHHQSWFEVKRELGASSDEIDIMLQMQDDDDSVPSCEVEEVKIFCRGACLEHLTSGTGIAGVQRGAWLDDRSSHRHIGAQHAREYKNPLTAKALYQSLKVKVRYIYRSSYQESSELTVFE